MSEQSILWTINSCLLGILVFVITILAYFIRKWFSRLEKDIEDILDELKLKSNQSTCDKIHTGVDKLLHRHASEGKAGEVVPK
jgi:hypothetical protein